MKQGWKKVKLPEVVFFQEGPGLRKFQYTEKGIPFLNIRTLVNDRIDKTLCGHISEKEVNEKYQHFLLNEGDIICSTSGTIGKLAIVHKEDLPVMLNTSVIRFREIDPSVVFKTFIYYYLKSDLFLFQAKDAAKGQAQVNFGPSHLKKFDFVLPPLPEQQRIVSILDEAFAAIAKAKANAEQNLKNAKELFESYLQGVFENGNWETKTIQEITKVVNGYAFASKDFKPTNTIKSVKITNVGVKEFVEEADNYLPEKFKETLKEFQVREGNIVIALTRTIISAGLKVAVVPASYDGALVNQRVAAIVPNEKLVNQNFLYFYLTTSGVAKYVLEHVNTLMQPNLSINDLKNMPVPCPNLKDQQTIVRQLDALRAETQKLEAVYQKKIDDLEELKKSILQKAFAGELRSPEGARYDSEAVTPLADNDGHRPSRLASR